MNFSTGFPREVKVMFLFGGLVLTLSLLGAASGSTVAGAETVVTLASNALETVNVTGSLCATAISTSRAGGSAAWVTTSGLDLYKAQDAPTARTNIATGRIFFILPNALRPSLLAPDNLCLRLSNVT